MQAGLMQRFPLHALLKSRRFGHTRGATNLIQGASEDAIRISLAGPDPHLESAGISGILQSAAREVETQNMKPKEHNPRTKRRMGGYDKMKTRYEACETCMVI